MVIDSVFRYFLSLCRKTHIHPHPFRNFARKMRLLMHEHRGFFVIFAQGDGIFATKPRNTFWKAMENVLEGLVNKAIFLSKILKNICGKIWIIQKIFVSLQCK